MVEAQTNLTTMFLQFILISCCFGVASSSYCPLNEYKAGTECCPSCPPGCHVVKDCTERSITKCKSCPDGTFQAGYNEQKQCSTCTKCDAGLGLKVKKSCSSTSDAVCEVLDGFFCSDSNRGGCRAAQSHRLSCSPGHYIDQRGTADKDTECLHCTDGTFSDGTRSSCKNHTKCDSEGGLQIQPGTDSTDSTCFQYVVIGVIIIGCITLVLGALICRRRLKRRKTLEEKRGLTEPSPLRSTDGPEPTRDQQECTTTTPDGTMDDHHGDQSLGPASPSSPTDNGSESVSDHQEDHQPVQTKRDSGASQSTLHSLMRSSTSQSARRFPVGSKSVSSCFESPKFSTDRVSLLMDNDVADEEVTPVREYHDQPESGSDDSNSLKPVPIWRDHGVSQVTPLSLGPPSPSRSTPLTLVPPSPSRSTPLSLGPPSTSQSPPPLSLGLPSQSPPPPSVCQPEGDGINNVYRS
ncbi:tumor necrosis factor receptor superfamily member 5-like isoform X6 [Gadus morhua]|uniref:tumor necrosis factor receptor superfamily member 5-like isoform X6 n=1 Tax=Gadus morhua TaxID=8049 RepID=UPI0011B5E66C|nr:tumor necrosis factor receptor superfamily member 5-like isoform X6 [Gadus morhua]XP_030224008.1 tumor necrosis factor receptor superfamily member 5-like isoform X6 [Gadus morhua]